MNPLSPFTYALRHKRLVLTLIAFQALAVAGLYLLIGLMLESYITPHYTMNRYLCKFSLVQPDQGNALSADATGRILANSDVEQTVPYNALEIMVPNLGGLMFSFRLIGLRKADVAHVMERSGVFLKEGEWLEPGTNGMMLSEEVARALKLNIGDEISRSVDETYYPSIIRPLRLVGILSGDVRLAVVSYEYLESQEAYRNQAAPGLLVLARPGREAAVDEFLVRQAAGAKIKTYGLQALEKIAAESEMAVLFIFGPIVILLSIAVALVINVIHQIAFTRRLPELGALMAVGRGKGWLVRRLAWETSVPALCGWAFGIALAVGTMAVLSDSLYAPVGFAFHPVEPPAILLLVPVPLTVIGLTLLSVTRAFARMDAVAIVERGDLSMEGEARSSKGRPANQPKPLAAITFYRRHKRRAAMTAGAMGMMVMGVALLVFIMTAVFDVTKPSVNNLSRMSLVSPNSPELEKTLTDRIRTSPMVERIIRAYPVYAIDIILPPVNTYTPVETYAVAAEDMAYLAGLYRLELAEGRMPAPGAAEIVLPWALAKNRGLAVGDVIGGRGHPAYEGAQALPSELTVSGIFARVENPDEENWLSFMSLEFVEPSRTEWKSAPLLIVTAESGQKTELDAWLEGEIGGVGSNVRTYGKLEAFFQKITAIGLFTISLMESVIALVAALALAGLNYVFITQRRSEFNLLNALGFSRPQLILRIGRETLFTTGAAWLAGALGCAALVVLMQVGMYEPVGFRLDFFNPIPWLFTLPVPAAVLAVSVATAAAMLSRLDPVAVIERRT
jgi:ABC-type lipoprotein release transport system permease subunit